jgi:hypothetical protein
MSKDSAEKKNDKKATIPELDSLLIGEKFIPFGDKYLSQPCLIRNYLSVRTKNKNYSKTWPMKPISFKFKKMLLDIIYKNKFEVKDYDALTEDEKILFDKLCGYCKMQTQAISRIHTSSQREREDLLSKFNILKGELLAGNSNQDIIRNMRNILLELRSKDYIPKNYFDKLMAEIVACL